MVSPANLPPRSDADPDGGSGAINIAHAVSLARFLVRAAGRRRVLTASVILGGAIVTASAAHVAPRTYTVQAKIFAQRQVSNPLLGNQRAEPVELVDAPTRAARETRATTEAILRQDNLSAIVAETKLPERWNEGRSPLERFVDAVRRVVSPPDPTEAPERTMVRVLEKKIGVQTDDSTIKLTLSWHQPEIAHQLMSCVVRNFLNDRNAVETAATMETITILERQAARQREAIDVALAAAEEAQKTAARAEANGKRHGGGETTVLTAAGIGDTRIETELADKHKAIQAAEEARQRRLAELRADLDKLRVTYTPGHPMVIAMEERLVNAAAAPGELAQLKREEDALLARLKAMGKAAAPIAAMEQPRVEAARIRLASSVNRYEELMGRLDSARLELHAAQATFKYRYVISEPPELPKKPEKPIHLIVLLLGAIVTAAIALGAAGVRELRRGRFVEPWQVRQKLPLPLLAEVEEP